MPEAKARFVRMGFRHLRVYQAALELQREVDRIFSSLSPAMKNKCANMISHVNEAVESVLNNIAEGNDSRYPKKKRNFMDIARCSAKEARNGVENVTARAGLTRKETSRAITLTFVIDKMLRQLTD